MLKEKNIKFWIQDYLHDHTHYRHTHGTDFLSGVYYIRANNDPGGIRFHNPNPFICPLSSLSSISCAASEVLL